MLSYACVQQLNPLLFIQLENLYSASLKKPIKQSTSSRSKHVRI